MSTLIVFTQHTYYKWKSFAEQTTYVTNRGLKYSRFFHSTGSIKWYNAINQPYVSLIENIEPYEKAHDLYQSNGPLAIFVLHELITKDVIGVIINKLIQLLI